MRPFVEGIEATIAKAPFRLEAAVAQIVVQPVGRRTDCAPDRLRVVALPREHLRRARTENAADLLAVAVALEEVRPVRERRPHVLDVVAHSVADVVALLKRDLHARRRELGTMRLDRLQLMLQLVLRPEEVSVGHPHLVARAGMPPMDVDDRRQLIRAVVHRLLLTHDHQRPRRLSAHLQRHQRSNCKQCVLHIFLLHHSVVAHGVGLNDRGTERIGSPCAPKAFAGRTSNSSVSWSDGSSSFPNRHTTGPLSYSGAR